MGGKALKNVTRSYTKDEYDNVCIELINKLKNIRMFHRGDFLTCFQNKQIFNDADFLYTTTNDVEFNIESVLEYFPTTVQIIRNKSIISFEYKQFQIDLIHVNNISYEYAKSYFTGDLGNLIGRVAHKFGLKHGHRGLTLPLRDGDNVFNEIILTRDYNKALTFLGFDIIEFDSGFESLEQIYNYVSKSKYFNPDIYKLENLNTIARVRDKKRPTYTGFLKFCSDIDSNKCFQFNPDKTVYLTKIFEYFHYSLGEFTVIMANLSMQKLAKEKFNGLIVSQYTGKTDKELGYLMKYLRNKPEFKMSFICYLTDTQIKNNILKYLVEFQSEENVL